MKQHLLILAFILLSVQSFAQRKTYLEEDEKKDQAMYFSYPEPEIKDRYRIAVLTPLYLDSVDLDRNLARLPKFMMPGIDFYQGIRIAADTLKNQGQKFNLYIYDSKASYQSVQKLISSGKMDSMDLIIGNASVSDLGLLADFAKKKKINFVSAVSPSDANQTANPYFTILQPRLVSHIEKMHAHINRKYADNNVIFISRKTAGPNNALQYFKGDPVNNLPGRFSEYEMKTDELMLEDIIPKIDSNYNTCIVLGILDAGLTYKTLKKLTTIARRFRLKVYCMPTAEAIKSLGKADEFPGMPVFYTTSYIIDKITPSSMYIGREYKRRMGTAPSDIVFKGFESLYFFSKMMHKHGVPFNDHISDNAYSFITPYKIMPVMEKKSINYFENKFLYLVKYDNGIVTYE
jgi:ABC-type branched-subunit amino acid transport system substrate-binding protein